MGPIRGGLLSPSSNTWFGSFLLLKSRFQYDLIAVGFIYYNMYNKPEFF
jgi:hypothetical protein